MLNSKIIINQSTATIIKLTLSLQRRSILNTFLLQYSTTMRILVVHWNENMAAQLKQNSTIKILVNVNLFIIMAESATGQDEANPVF